MPYTQEADRTLGKVVADEIRTHIDDAIAAVQAAPISQGNLARALEQVDERLGQAGIIVHRPHPGQTGWSLNVDGHRLSGSNFGHGYSGPVLRARLLGQR